MRNYILNYKLVWPKHNYVQNNKRKQAREPIAFQELRPLKLRNSVSSKEEKTTDSSCLQEMAVMFACLKTNDFKEPACAQEIQGFQNCYKEWETSKKEAQSKEGELIPGAKKLTSRQLNTLLAKYPQFNNS